MSERPQHTFEDMALHLSSDDRSTARYLRVAKPFDGAEMVADLLDKNATLLESRLLRVERLGVPAGEKLILTHAGPATGDSGFESLTRQLVCESCGNSGGEGPYPEIGWLCMMCDYSHPPRSYREPRA